MPYPITIQKKHTYSGHNDCVYALSKWITADSFLSAGGDGMIVVWSLTEPDKGELLAKVPNSIYALCMDDVNGYLIAGQNFEGIHVFDIHSRKEIYSRKISQSAIFDIKQCTNTYLIASGNGEVVIVDAIQRTIETRLKHSESSARCIAVHPSYKVFAVGYSDHSIRIFDAQSYQLIHTLTSHTNSVFSLEYSHDGNTLFSTGRDAHICIWNTASYVLLESIPAHLYAINSISLHPKRLFFATASMDKSIKIWSTHTHQLLKVIDKARHAGHGTSINKILWLDDPNHTLISASDDRCISIWDVQIDM